MKQHITLAGVIVSAGLIVVGIVYLVNIMWTDHIITRQTNAVVQQIVAALNASAQKAPATTPAPEEKK